MPEITGGGQSGSVAGRWAGIGGRLAWVRRAVCLFAPPRPSQGTAARGRTPSSVPRNAEAYPVARVRACEGNARLLQPPTPRLLSQPPPPPARQMLSWWPHSGFSQAGGDPIFPRGGPASQRIPSFPPSSFFQRLSPSQGL